MAAQAKLNHVPKPKGVERSPKGDSRQEVNQPLGGAPTLGGGL